MTDEDILDGLDFDPDEPDDDSTTVDVSRLSDFELSTLLAETREKLHEISEMYADLQNTFETEAATPEARELHSIRAACLVEMSKRGMR